MTYGIKLLVIGFELGSDVTVTTRAVSNRLVKSFDVLAPSRLALRRAHNAATLLKLTDNPVVFVLDESLSPSRDTFERDVYSACCLRTKLN